VFRPVDRAANQTDTVTAGPLESSRLFGVLAMTLRLARRDFIRSLAAAGAATSWSAQSWARVAGANERLRVASVGTGGKGKSDLEGVAASPHVQVVALCNIDDSQAHLGWAKEKYSDAKTFVDWRKVLDDSKGIDAVIVS